MIEHHIQRDIVNRLSRASSLRFSQLKPKELEANLFMYHVKQLMKMGYVQKAASGYELAPLGLTYVDGLSTTDSKPRKQPKVISILVLQNTQGEWLLGRRKLQPYIGRLMFPSGKQHFGESPEQHSRRELFEKTGLKVPLKRLGLADIRITQNGNLMTHVIGHVYSGNVSTGAEVPETDQHSYEWHRILPESHELMPGTAELLDRVKTSTDLFFLSLELSE